MNFGKVDMSACFGGSWLARKFSGIVFWRDAGLGQPGDDNASPTSSSSAEAHMVWSMGLKSIWSTHTETCTSY